MHITQDLEKYTEDGKIVGPLTRDLKRYINGKIGNFTTFEEIDSFFAQDSVGKYSLITDKIINSRLNQLFPLNGNDRDYNIEARKALGTKLNQRLA